jgi:hypothetical protein
MAIQIGFKEANVILKAPPGMEEQVSTLEVYRDGTYCISKWQFSDQEIDEMKKNGNKCYLMILGSSMPPVIVTSLDPFKTYGILKERNENET